ncbi:hypothetical protein MYSTI_00660 [Myxococcus stipitatus DSM 14675]|uniref:Uncharacterized protein n=1 Tax=Myxococcus stipitatus (strain DSM 14675 / JCM 12634 / Mx s8) TaxID=1278073 RepID=L7U2H5_MYXSD|nr:hypothetical protein [Myxococcus stipitatus]AGC42010.1 hypothetical protein MYSTI_00660 [Myxococcus stipitatus DSM 14675]
MIVKSNVEQLIRRGAKLGLIRLDSPLPDSSQGEYKALLDNISALLERLRHGATMRRMMYEYAEVCQAPLKEQLAAHQASVDRTRGKPGRFDVDQLRGLERLQSSYKAMKQELRSSAPSDPTAPDAAETLKRQKNDKMHNPNVMVNCGSGTDGELGCRPGHIKVYQAVFGASYGQAPEGKKPYKDVYVHNVRGQDQILICPAGGKCNVSIGNPYRSLGWFFNYVTQGSRTALIRMWEIPATYFEDLLACTGTEAQIKDMKDFYKAEGKKTAGKKNQRFHVELCDHRATNQFGIWTHDNGRLTDFGRKFQQMSSRLVTYYDENGDHVPSSRDGECRDIQRLIDHLGVPTGIEDRFQNLSTAVSDSDGNLTMNAEAARQDLLLLDLINLLSDASDEALPRLNELPVEQVRVFSHLLIYNGLSPQRFNQTIQYTSTGLVVENLNRESAFMVAVHKSTAWHASLRSVVDELLDHLAPSALEMPSHIAANVRMVFRAQSQEKFRSDTYDAALTALRELITPGTPNRNLAFIEGLGLLLRPMCTGDGSFDDDLKPISTKGNRQGDVKTPPEKFRFLPLADLKYEVGVSHRAKTHGMAPGVDSLDGHTLAGFTSVPKFKPPPLRADTETSNTRFQTFLHAPVISRLHDAGLPVMGGISGTTRDIFRYFGHLDGQTFWHFFAVVAAFMVKNHFHSLAECYIAALQFHDRGNQASAFALPTLSPQALYNHLRRLTGVTFE